MYKDLLDKLPRSGAGVESEDEDLHIDWSDGKSSTCNT